MSYWPSPRYRCALQYEKRRHGEGRIENAFNAPWMNTPLGQNYSEPFPTGIVEESAILSLELAWQPVWWLRLKGLGKYWNVINVENQSGVDSSFGEWWVSIDFDWIKKWKI